MKRSFNTQAIVINRKNIGEADRIITLLTRDYGKLTCISKGVRKLKSSKRAFLEPGNIVSVFLIKTKSLPILTQVRLLEDLSNLRTDLVKIRKLTQILEIVNNLFVPEQPEEIIFDQLTQIILQLGQSTTQPKQIRKQLSQIIRQLGFMGLEESGLNNMSQLVAEISEKKMKGWEYLTVKS